jgi:hypothetical protein
MEKASYETLMANDMIKTGLIKINPGMKKCKICDHISRENLLAIL